VHAALSHHKHLSSSIFIKSSSAARTTRTVKQQQQIAATSSDKQWPSNIIIAPTHTDLNTHTCIHRIHAKRKNKNMKTAANP